MQNIFRNLPSVNQLLESEPLKKLVESVNHTVVADGVRTFLDDVRQQVSDKAGDINVPSPQEMASMIADFLKAEEVPYLRRVINGTGIILHTGLGRAPLASKRSMRSRRYPRATPVLRSTLNQATAVSEPKRSNDCCAS